MLRALFGLGSLLIVVGIIFYIFVMDADQAVKSGKVAGDQAEQISGHSTDHTPFNASYTVVAENDPSGKFHDLLVTGVTPGGGADVYYGLKKGDKIINAGPLTFAETGTDPAAIKDFLLDDYEKQRSFDVIRDGQQVSLPLASAPSPVAGSPSAPSTPSTPTANSVAPATPGTANSQSPATKPPGSINNARSQAQNLIDQLQQRDNSGQ